MNTPYETPGDDAYTALHFGVFAATSQLAPAFMTLVQSQTQSLLGRHVHMSEVKEVMANSKEDLKRALCGISRSNRLANCPIATTNFAMGAPLWDCDRHDSALPFTLPTFDRFTSKDGDLFTTSEVADPETKHPVRQNVEDEVVKEPEIVKEKEEDSEKEAVVQEKSVDVSVCHADLHVTESSKRIENAEEGGLNPKSSDEMNDDRRNDREEDEEQEMEEHLEETEAEEEEVKEEEIEAKEEILEKEIEAEVEDDKSTVVEEQASGDMSFRLANKTFHLSIETPILHQVFDEPNDMGDYRTLEEITVSEISHDMEEDSCVKSPSEAPTLVHDVDSKRTSPGRAFLEFAQVGEEPEPWKPIMGQIYSVVITYAKDPNDFYIMRRPRFDEHTVSAKLRIWWAKMKSNPDIYVKPAAVVPGLPVGVIRSPSRIERGIVVSLACDKPSAEIRLVDRGFHEMVPFSRLCYLSKAHLISEFPAAVVRCSVDARTNKLLDDGTPIWPPKVIGSLRKAVDTAVPYNAIFYSFDGEKYVANLYIQKYGCEEDKSLLFHVIKHLGRWNQEEQSPTLSAAGSFAIPTVVQEMSPTLSAAGSFAIPTVVQEMVRTEQDPSTATRYDSTVGSELDIQDVDLAIEDNDVGLPRALAAVAAIPAVPAPPPKPFPSRGFPPIPR